MEHSVASQLPLIQDFLLAFTALFSIVNPIGTAFLFQEVTKHKTEAEKRDLARRTAFYAFMVMICSLWIGAYVLKFFGISLAALRLAGGFVVAATAWQMLSGPDAAPEASGPPLANRGDRDMAFVPLTMPMTTGPGTISVAIALGANRPIGDFQLARFAIASAAAVALISLAILLFYRGAGTVLTIIGHGGAQTVSKLAAFLLLCVGVQIGLNGLADAMMH
jgi:multiple antibiotic resistance protein